MGGGNQEAVKQLQTLMENVDDEQLKNTFQIMHQGYQTETLIRFLKARDWSVAKAHKMKPIPTDLYKAIRDSQLIGMSGYSKEDLPVIAVGVGLSTYDKASDKYYIQSHIQLNEYRDRVILPTATRKHGRYIGTCVKVLDMSGLKFSALNQLRLLTAISTIDDLNYPEKTDTYYIVNAPYVFSACWKVVKPLLQERTRRKIQVLQGCGKEELLRVMDYASLPHFCRKEDSKSSKHHASGNSENCFSFNHAFHQQLYNHIKQQAIIMESISPIRQGSFCLMAIESYATKASNCFWPLLSHFYLLITLWSLLEKEGYTCRSYLYPVIRSNIVMFASTRCKILQADLNLISTTTLR
ncbi:SEC14 cytosolic factor [Glycine max]|nr:SEC14 cytosolic factor [Glycine max]